MRRLKFIRATLFGAALGLASFAGFGAVQAASFSTAAPALCGIGEDAYPVTRIANKDANGKTAVSVTCDNGVVFKKVGDGWQEFDTAGKGGAKFKETQRDEWSVYLRDDSRDVNIQIDLFTQFVKYSTGKAPPANLYAIVKAEAGTVAPVAAAPAPAAPKAPVTDAPTTVAVAAGGEVFEDVPDMKPEEIQKVMQWIRTETVGTRLPFCWRQTKVRGAGELQGRVSDCPDGYTNTGLTCGRGADTIAAPSLLASCPEHYVNMGLTCFQPLSTYTKKWGDKCREGFTNFGFTCTGGGDSLTASHMVCPDGYFKDNVVQRCHKNCPEGYTNTGETCFKGVDTKGIGAMHCKAGEELKGLRCFPVGKACFGGKEVDATGGPLGLCFDKCAAGFDGVGPVCWQSCPKDWQGCAAGCGKSKGDCAMTVGDQILEPAIVLANIITFGAAVQGTAEANVALKGTEETVEIAMKGGKVARWVAKAGDKAGVLFGKAVKGLQTINPDGLEKGATITRRIFFAKLGTPSNVLKTGKKVVSVAHTAVNDYSEAFADEFDKNTSPDINKAIDENFHPLTGRFLKKEWAKVQLAEMAEANHWEIATTVLSVASIADISGATGLVNAYAKPLCETVVPFPCVVGSVKECKP